jgi:hypothetical protein
LALTIAAVGFLLVAANSSKDIEFAAQNRALYYASESGILAGAGWIKAHDSLFFETAFEDSFTLQDFNDGDLLSPRRNPFKTRISIHLNPAPKMLKSISTLGPGKDTVQITWRLDRLRDSVGTPGHCRAFLSFWQETIFPGRP